MKTLFAILLSFLLLLYPANHAYAADFSDPCSYHPINNADASYSTYAEQDFVNPEEIRSQNGVLETTLEVKYGDNKIAGCPVHLRSYNGKLVGPTLRVE